MYLFFHVSDSSLSLINWLTCVILLMLAMSDAVFVSVFLFFISSLDLFWRSYLKDSSKLREGKVIQRKWKQRGRWENGRRKGQEWKRVKHPSFSKEILSLHMRLGQLLKLTWRNINLLSEQSIWIQEIPGFCHLLVVWYWQIT